MVQRFLRASCVSMASDLDTPPPPALVELLALKAFGDFLVAAFASQQDHAARRAAGGGSAAAVCTKSGVLLRGARSTGVLSTERAVIPSEQPQIFGRSFPVRPAVRHRRVPC